MVHRTIGRAARALALVTGRALALAAAGALVATLHGSAANAQAQVFRVGVVTALSGDNAQGGASTKRGYDLWANAVNAQGGIQTGGGKYKVELVYFDDQSSAASASAACERMLTQGNVDFILGPYASSATRACGPIVDKYKVPMITGSAENPQIWKDHYKFVFGTIPSVDIIGAAPLRALADVKPKPQTMYIVALDDPFTKAGADEFKRLGESLGMKVVGYDVVPAEADFTPVFNKVKQANADIIAMATQPEQAIGMMKVVKQLRVGAKAFVQHNGPGFADYTKTLGKDADYAIDATVWQPEIEYTVNAGAWKSSKAWFADYQKTYKRPEAEYTEAGSSAAGIAFEAALKAANLKPGLDAAGKQKLADALEKINIMTFYGPVKFETAGDHYHDDITLQPQPFQIQGGKVVIVGAKSPTKAALRYPAPAWDKR
jgi:branched-chain amino acid transport system substrate-binding protein